MLCAFSVVLCVINYTELHREGAELHEVSRPAIGNIKTLSPSTTILIFLSASAGAGVISSYGFFGADGRRYLLFAVAFEEYSN